MNDHRSQPLMTSSEVVTLEVASVFSSAFAASSGVEGGGMRAGGGRREDGGGRKDDGGGMREEEGGRREDGGGLRVGGGGWASNQGNSSMAEKTVFLWNRSKSRFQVCKLRHIGGCLCFARGSGSRPMLGNS